MQASSRARAVKVTVAEESEENEETEKSKTADKAGVRADSTAIFTNMSGPTANGYRYQSQYKIYRIVVLFPDVINNHASQKDRCFSSMPIS